jgi:hypothetical protein
MDLSFPSGPFTYVYGSRLETALGRSVASDRGRETLVPGAVVHASSPIPIGKILWNSLLEELLGEGVVEGVNTAVLLKLAFVVVPGWVVVGVDSAVLLKPAFVVVPEWVVVGVDSVVLLKPGPGWVVVGVDSALLLKPAFVMVPV